MRILLVCQYFHPESNRVNDVCLSLRNLGHEIVVLTGIPNYPEGSFFKGYSWSGPLNEVWEGIEIVRVPLIPRGRGGSIRLALNYMSFVVFSCIRALGLCNRTFDMVFVYQLSPITMALPAMVVSHLKNIPMVLYSLDIWPESVAASGTHLPVILTVGLMRLSNFIYRSADRLLVSSRGFIEHLADRLVDKEKMAYWPQAAEETYRVIALPDDAPERVKVPYGFVVMFAGNIGASQGFPTILDAAEKLRDLKELHWVVLGDGRMRGWVETEVQTRGLEGCFHLMGRYPAIDMPRWFSLADAMLVTLKKEPVFALTLPAKVQSYLACGKPILAAMDGEGAKVVREANAGFACDGDDPAGLVDIVRKMVALPKAERESLGKNGARYAVNNFNKGMLMHDLDMILSNAIREEETAKGE